MTDTPTPGPVRVLFVCMGNICRSPTAEGVFRQLLAEHGLQERVEIDSAGTGSWHVGRPPDARAREAASRRGIDISALRGRQVCHADFEYFDYIVAMDRANIASLRELANPVDHQKLHLMMSFDDAFGEEEVPDPYYGGDSGFDRVLDMIESASAGLLGVVRQRSGI